MFIFCADTHSDLHRRNMIPKEKKEDAMYAFFYESHLRKWALLLHKKWCKVKLI